MLTVEQISQKFSKENSCEGKKSISEKIMRQLVFIAEVDKIKQVMRRTLLTDSSRRENDAEHSWHLALMSILLEEYAAEPVDLERVLKMVTIHDLVEIYAGDTFAFDVVANQDKEARETEAAEKLFGLLPEEQGIELRALWQEFDAMDTADSRFAASLDRLQPFMHNILTDGHTWKLGNVSKEQVLKRMDPIRTGTPALWSWVQEQIELAMDKGYISN
ncbi:MAG: HD domain-containing protein [Spirochaetaceae bacterium]|nr:HD domain-containing protein [Spirochaetaceae bacterium]